MTCDDRWHRSLEQALAKMREERNELRKQNKSLRGNVTGLEAKLRRLAGLHPAPEAIAIPLAYYRALEEVHGSMTILIDEGLRHWDDEEKSRTLKAFEVLAAHQPEGDQYGETGDES